MNATILVVDDDASLRRVTSMALSALGEVRAAGSGEKALEILAQEPIHCVVTDLRMEGMDGLALLGAIREHHPHLPTVLLTAFGTVDTAVSALKVGAYDYLTKPVATRDLRRVVERALEHGHLLREVESLRTRVGPRPLGQAPAWRQILDLVDRLATNDSTLLLMGESGTGKEVLARYLHARSDRSEGPFVAVNCAALPGELLESELFGHAKGAFTGAHKAHEGRFRAAKGGTLLLDEIGEMPTDLQSKLLRALQEREVQPVGGSEAIAIDARVIAATNSNLEEAVAQGSFRSDLYYRLAVLPVRVPPLRERPGDAPLLFSAFVSEFSGSVLPLDTQAMELLEAQAWPGNVRELRNLAERCWLLGLSSTVTGVEIHRALAYGSGEAPPMLPTMANSPGPIPLDLDHLTLPPDSLPLYDLEAAVIRAALLLHDGNQTATARYLAIPRHRLLYRMEKYSIE